MRNGTIRWKIPGGVTSSSAAPPAPPSAHTVPSLRTVAACPASSRRELGTAVMLPSASATVFVTFAAVAGSPARRSAG